MKITNITGTSFLRENLNVNQFNNRTYSKLLTSPISDQVSFRKDNKEKFYLSRSSGVVLKQDIKKLIEMYDKQPETVNSYLEEPVVLTDEQVAEYEAFFNCSGKLEEFGFSKKEGTEKEPVYTAPRLTILTLPQNYKYSDESFELLKKVAKRNPELFSSNDMFSLFSGNKNLQILDLMWDNSFKQEKGEETRAKIIDGICRKSDYGTYSYLKMRNCELSPARKGFLNKLIAADPVNMSVNVINHLGTQSRNGLVFNSITSPRKLSDPSTVNIVEVLKIVDSEDSSLDVTKKLVAIAEKDPDSIYAALMIPSNKTGQLYVNSMLEDPNRNYEGIMYYLLASDPARFFDMADKSNCFWFASGNDNQMYLDLMVDSLNIDPMKTIELLSKPYGNKPSQKNQFVSFDDQKIVYSTPAQRCVENKGVDYSQLLQACYQILPKSHSFAFFNQKVGGKPEEQVNLLTHYVNEKGFYSENFISYLVNSNLLFVRNLLSHQQLLEMQYASYKALKEELGGRIDQLNDKVDKEFSKVNARIICLQNQIDEERIANMARHLDMQLQVQQLRAVARPNLPPAYWGGTYLAQEHRYLVDRGLYTYLDPLDPYNIHPPSIRNVPHPSYGL